MKEARNGDIVKVHYTGKVDDGEVFDSSEGREPLEFTIGNGELIKGFEAGVVGMRVGDNKQVEILPEDGYGFHREELSARVPQSQLPEHIDATVGQMLQIKQPDGGVINVKITDVTEETVTLDANHPLAGKTLVFDIDLVEIG